MTVADAIWLRQRSTAPFVANRSRDRRRASIALGRSQGMIETEALQAWNDRFDY
jgi:hypothetical protein